VSGQARQFELEGELGLARLDRVLAGRLRALGLTGVGGAGTTRSDAGWAERFRARIERLIPGSAGPDPAA
jgi:hypothetical protein